MALRASLRRMFRRLLQKLYKKKLRSKERGTPAVELPTDKVDKPFRLLSLPIELLLQILDILSSATPVESSSHRDPIVSLRL